MKNKQQLTKAQIIAKFEEFLKENNCYDDFVEGLKTNSYNVNTIIFYDSYTFSITHLCFFDLAS